MIGCAEPRTMGNNVQTALEKLPTGNKIASPVLLPEGLRRVPGIA